MKKMRSFAAFQLFLALISFVIIASSFGYDMYQVAFPEAQYIRDVRVSVNGGEDKSITLPYAFSGLRGGTPVTVTAMITPNEGDLIYIKTVYSPAKIYTDGTLIYELGKEETYPSYMIDPATEIYLATPSVFDREVELRMEFLSPSTRSTLTVHPPIMTTFKSLFLEMLKIHSKPFFFSVVQLAIGVFLCVISILLHFFEKKFSKVSFWLGMFAFTSGLWAFGECNFTALMIKNPTLLYLFAFIGFVTLAVPLIHLCLSLVDFKNPAPLLALSAFMTLSAAVSVLLQFLGLRQLSSSMFVFHIITPLSLCTLTFFTIFEAFAHGNLQAKRFIVPILILTIFALVEMANYYFRFTYKFASLFQDGIIIFILVMGFTVGFYIRDIAVMRRQNERLAFEVGLMGIQMEEQKKYNELIAENEKTLKKQRHDLHHHLIAIRELAGSGNEKLEDYLSSLTQNVPILHSVYCENKAVNAIVSHYAAICAAENIEMCARLNVPVMKEASFDSDLSVIFGNLLENAIEACRRVESGGSKTSAGSAEDMRSAADDGRNESGGRFIRISSDMSYDLLVITMDNSFDGKFSYEGGKFRSSKRNDFGVGLSSIQYTAQKYGGDAKFEGKNGHFQSSVYINCAV